MVNVCRFHWFELVLPKRSISAPKNWQVSRHHHWVRGNESVRLLIEVSPNLAEPGWQREDKFHHSRRNLLLPTDARGTTKCRPHFLQNDRWSFRQTEMQKSCSIHGWHCGQERQERNPHLGSLINIQEPKKERPQVKSEQMYIQHRERQIAWLLSISERHQGKSWEDSSDSQHEATYKQKAGAEAYW